MVPVLMDRSYTPFLGSFADFAKMKISVVRRAG